MASDMDLLMDIMPEENIVFDTVVEQGKTNEYYQGLAEHYLQQIDTEEHYFHFLMTILNRYPTLSEEQKKKVIQRFDIPPVIKTIVKEKIVYKEKKVSKAKLNMYDDY